MFTLESAEGTREEGKAALSETTLDIAYIIQIAKAIEAELPGASEPFRIAVFKAAVQQHHPSLTFNWS